MKYANEVINLLAAYPGRLFKMSQIINVIAGGDVTPSKRHALREAVRAVLLSLIDLGHVEQVKITRTSAMYKWTIKNCKTELMQTASKTAIISPRTVAS